MYLKKRIYITIFPLFIMVAIFSLFVCIDQRFIPKVFASAANGVIDGTNKYAWSENAGWINFGTTQGNVIVTDAQLTGYAWSENAGWISLNCSNDNSCGTASYKVINDGYGVLSGYAWGENVGWINFNPAYGGVTINSSTGEFSGYAWGENTGWIVFNCSTSACVKTDWRRRISGISLTILQKTGKISTSTLMVPPEIVKSSTSTENLVLEGMPKGFVFTKDLKFGNQNKEVKYLQIFLKSQGAEIYPEGIVSGWFGPLTRKAVVRFQEKYKEEVLAPWGLVKGSGFVGKTTRTKINEILSR